MSAPSFCHLLQVLQHQDPDEIRLRHVLSTKTIAIKSTKGCCIEFVCFVISLLDWHETRTRLSEATTSDAYLWYHERLDEVYVMTNFRHAPTEPLFRQFLIDFQSGTVAAHTNVDCEKEKEKGRDENVDARSERDSYVEMIIH